jgi:uncharacterized protein
MRFELYRSGWIRKEWRWKFISSNGRTIAVSSEGYRNYGDCLDGVVLVMETDTNTPVHSEH